VKLFLFQPDFEYDWFSVNIKTENYFLKK
jgi:hypothetical protein